MSMGFKQTKTQFYLPDGVIYLDGNSLGPLPIKAPSVVTNTMQDEWGEMLIGAWNDANWMALSKNIGNRIARLIGAECDHVMMGDTLSIKVYQALASALELNPERKVILSDNGNFPSDLYMAQGLIRSLKQDHQLKLVEPDDIRRNLSEDVAVLMLTEVDYKTGAKHDMQALTKKAHQLGIITVWDLAHSAGAIEVNVAEAKADFAVGCSYKYLNGGPGAPAFIYVAAKHAEKVLPALSGWLGHDAPFNFDLDYKAGRGIERMRVGTPAILALKSLSSALDIWDQISMDKVQSRSRELSDYLIEQVEKLCPQLELVSPRDASKRGSQVSFAFEHGFAAMGALIDRNVVGDFRAPNIMRFGITPLYIGEDDLLKAAKVIADVINNKLWDQPKYQQRTEVT